jgi:hypothetical protein
MTLQIIIANIKICVNLLNLSKTVYIAVRDMCGIVLFDHCVWGGGAGCYWQLCTLTAILLIVAAISLNSASLV